MLGNSHYFSDFFINEFNNVWLEQKENKLLRMNEICYESTTF